MFLCLPIVCETLLVGLCFLSCSVLTPWVFGVNFCDRIPVRFNGTVSFSPDFTDLGLWFMLALCMSLVLVLFGSVFVGSFPSAGYVRVSLSPTSCFLLCRCGQVVLELVLLCVQGFEAFLLLLLSCLF